MNAGRSRKVLLAALAISVLLHLLFAGYFYWPPTTQQVEERVANIRITQIARQKPAPPQTPAPRTTHRPARTTPIRSRSHIAVPHVRSTGGPPGIPARTVAAPTPRAAAAATPRPRNGCAKPDSPSALSATPDTADISAQARASKTNGTTAIDVTLDAQGRVTGTKLSQSSGNDGLDATALAMARDAGYSPKFVACKAVASTYTFTVRFVAW